MLKPAVTYAFPEAGKNLHSFSFLFFNRFSLFKTLTRKGKNQYTNSDGFSFRYIMFDCRSFRNRIPKLWLAKLDVYKNIISNLKFALDPNKNVSEKLIHLYFNEGFFRVNITERSNR